MASVTLEIEGAPAAKQSARFIRGRVVGVGNTSKALIAWNEAIALAVATAAETADNLQEIVSAAALELRATFRLKVSKARAGKPHTSAPDLDNLAKALCDGLVSCGLISGDEKIIRMVLEKIPVSNKPPGATVTVRTLGDG